MPSNQEIVVFYPGSFSPIHIGHLSLIERCLNYPNVAGVIVVKGRGERDGFDYKSMYEFDKLFFDPDSIDVQFILSDKNSPIEDIYELTRNISKNDKNNNYWKFFMLSSDKDNDKRTEQYYQYFKDFSNIDVVDLDIDTSPLEINGKIISSSDLRKLIKENNFDEFIKYYPNEWLKKYNLTVNEIKKEFNKLTKNISESFYPKLKYPVLNEGGAYQHIPHVYEDLELSFKDLKNIIKGIAFNKINNLTEKVDGVNLMVTKKDGDILFSRNTTQSKNYGENALNIIDFKFFIEEKDLPSAVKQAFIDAATQLEFVLSQININFEDGKKWLSVEIIDTNIQNVIPYNHNEIIFSDWVTLDEDGEVVFSTSTDLKRLADKCNELSDNPFYIVPANKVEVESESIDKKIIEKFISLIDDLGDDSELLGNYVIDIFYDYLNETAELNNINFNDLKRKDDGELIENLLSRWIFDDKTIPINKLTKSLSDDEKNFIYQVDEEKGKIIAEILEPIEQIFIDFGVYIISHLNNIINRNTDFSNDILDKLNNNIDLLSDSDDIEDIEFVKNQLHRIGGRYDKLTPSEGIVFKYKSKLFKLTGVFGPINQLIGKNKFKANK